MSQEKFYQVKYTIDVDSSKGTKEVQNFAASVKELNQAKLTFDTAVKNINKFVKDMDSLFRTKGGRKKDFSFTMKIDTTKSEESLGRVKTAIEEIRKSATGIKLVVDTGGAATTKALKDQAKKALNNQKGNNKVDAKSATESILAAQQRITKSVGKINGALISLERGRELRIKTDTAKSQLQEVLNLLTKIKNASTINMLTYGGRPGYGGAVVPFAPNGGVPISDKANRRLQDKLYSSQRVHQQRLTHQQELADAREQERSALSAARKIEKEQARIKKQEDKIRRQTLAERRRKDKEETRRKQRNALNDVRQVQRNANLENSLYGATRRGAINRLQYSRAPSVRNLPFGYMLNAYMGYSIMKRNLTEAVEYSNIMQTAHSILRVADDDLGTFETRFSNMANYVRQIGVETKFTAIEVAGAVKYLSMAGMGVSTIMESIRPITNLALIGDNDIAEIADLATNIMAGYNIKSSSMGSVADILASTVSRSNVNIVEVAESYKMAAGYLKLSGVDFTEASAAIGILGNAGMKGTMAGTALRAMSTRFAKPTKEAQKTMDRLGVKFTQFVDVYGKKVEKLKPLADIFQELNEKGATLADMQSIFGKIGGNASMMFLNNYDKLRELTAQNATSHGIAGELALVKQNTTKGLWYQVTSQFSESFMQAFEVLEPQIQGVLKDFLERFKAKDFAKGLQSIGSVMIDILATLGKFATWVTTNFHWIEPMLFTGFVAIKLYKLAAALTNVGVAIGFIGKQSAATSTLQLLNGLTGFGGFGGLRGLRGMTMANKKTLVTALRAAGVSGKGAMTRYLMSTGMRGGASAFLTRGAASGLFASQVATGNGLMGATASLSAMGATAVAATAGMAALAGAIGWVAYKTWKVYEAKEAVQEEIKSNREYHYPSIDALYKSLNKTYLEALRTKKATDDLTAGKTLEEVSGQKIGAFTGNWWAAVLSNFGRGSAYGNYGNNYTAYSTRDAYQDDTRAALRTVAQLDGHNYIKSAWGDLGKYKEAFEVDAYIDNIFNKFGQKEENLESSWYKIIDGKAYYKEDMDKITAGEATKTWDYAQVINEEFIPKIREHAKAYRNAIASYDGAKNLIEQGGFKFSMFEELGFHRNKQGEWVQNELPKNATDEDRKKSVGNRMQMNDALVKFVGSLRKTFHGDAMATENVMQAAGIPRGLYSNEPNSNDMEPYKANGITNLDDGGAGGNYSGTGKLSSAAPKQVIVNIENLMSVKTIDLMKSENGQTAEIQNLKEQMAQALIDVVHDFDASWNS